MTVQELDKRQGFLLVRILLDHLRAWDKVKQAFIKQLMKYFLHL